MYEMGPSFNSKVFTLQIFLLKFWVRYFFELIFLLANNNVTHFEANHGNNKLRNSVYPNYRRRFFTKKSRRSSKYGFNANRGV